MVGPLSTRPHSISALRMAGRKADSGGRRRSSAERRLCSPSLTLVSGVCLALPCLSFGVVYHWPNASHLDGRRLSFRFATSTTPPPFVRSRHRSRPLCVWQPRSSQVNTTRREGSCLDRAHKLRAVDHRCRRLPPPSALLACRYCHFDNNITSTSPSLARASPDIPGLSTLILYYRTCGNLPCNPRPACECHLLTRVMSSLRLNAVPCLLAHSFVPPTRNLIPSPTHRSQLDSSTLYSQFPTETLPATSHVLRLTLYITTQC